MVDSVNFASSEVASEGILKEIITRGGETIFDNFLSKEAFANAAEVTCDALVAHLRMCFVAHDSDPQFADDSWREEARPRKNEIDSWSRQCVAVETLGMRERNVDKPVKNTRMSTVSSPASRAVDRKKEAEKDKGKKDTGKDEDDRRTKIAIPVVREDEEEARCRELKLVEERQAKDEKYRQEEEVRLKEEKKLKQKLLLEEMDKRPHTFDSDGNLMWITAPNIPKLPKTTQEFPFKCTDVASAAEIKEVDPKEEKKKDSRSSRSNRPKSRTGKSPKISPKAKARPNQFTDTFTRLTSEQPPIIDTMQCTSGVMLGSEGRIKKGPAAADPSNQMSRSSYEAIVTEEQQLFRGDRQAISRGEEEKADAPPEFRPPEAADELPPVRVNTADLPKGMGSVYDFNAALVDDPTWGANPTEVDEQKQLPMTSAPSTTKNWSMKRNAIGNLGRLPRHHIAGLGTGYGGSSRCLPQPVIGATMGHGLSSTDSFFFPPKDKLPKKEIPRVQKQPLNTYMSKSSSDFRELGQKLGRLNRKAGLADGAIRSESRSRLLLQSAIN